MKKEHAIDGKTKADLLCNAKLDVLRKQESVYAFCLITKNGRRLVKPTKHRTNDLRLANCASTCGKIE